ncbi:MAG: tRNA (pseudouridine(54)-N(1))-methyltransferase TrmY [Thermoplasmatota archaeon]
MSDLESILGVSRRNFLLVAHRARTDDGIQLNDLCGASGRWDGVSRAITSALFLSHDMRRDTSIHVLLLGPPDPPKLLSIDGGKVKYLNPDERASSALMRKCLAQPLDVGMGASNQPSPGISIIRSDLDSILASFKGNLVLLDEDGVELEQQLVGELPSDSMMFILSDDQNLSTEESSTIEKYTPFKCRLGDRVLHSHMAISIVHYLLDRFMER